MSDVPLGYPHEDHHDPALYWSSEFETPRISRHCLTAIAISGPGVQLRPPARSMLPNFEDEGAPGGAQN